jgi:hypothetical protein
MPKKSKSQMPCNKPMKSWRSGKKSVVKACSGGKEKIVHFGATGYGHNYSPAARKSFRARQRCHTANDKLTARYWACKHNWAGKGGSTSPPPRRKSKRKSPKKKSRRKSPKRKSKRKSPKRKSKRKSLKKKSRRKSPKRKSKRKSPKKKSRRGKCPKSCWKGYRRVPGMGCGKGSCVKK